MATPYCDSAPAAWSNGLWQRYHLRLEPPSRLHTAAFWAPGQSWDRVGPAVQPWSLSEAPPQSTGLTFGHAGDASQLKDVQAQLQANIHRPVPVVVIDVQGRFLKKFVTPQSWDPWAPGFLPS